MATADPTNARLRDFDIPVIMPRIDYLRPADFHDSVLTGDWLHDRWGSPWGPPPFGTGNGMPDN